MIVVYALVARATQMLWLTYAAITTTTARRYGVSDGTVGWLAEIFPLLYVVLAVPAGSLLDRHSGPPWAVPRACSPWARSYASAAASPGRWPARWRSPSLNR